MEYNFLNYSFKNLEHNNKVNADKKNITINSKS